MCAFSINFALSPPIYVYCIYARSMTSFHDIDSVANDWTLYPFSTQNEKDYYNLMSVYMDCVFHPLLRELDFRFDSVLVDI